MAKHLVSTLKTKGFTEESIDRLKAAGLLKGDTQVVWTQKSPSCWPKEYRALWYAHAPRHGNEVHAEAGMCSCGVVHTSHLGRLFNIPAR